MQLLRFFQLILPLAIPFCVFADDPDITIEGIEDVESISKIDFLTENFNCLSQKGLGYNENHISHGKFPCLTGGIEYSFSPAYYQSRIEVRDGTNVLATASSGSSIILKFKYPVYKFTFELVTFGGVLSVWQAGFYDSSDKLIKQRVIPNSGLENDNTRVSYSSVDFPFTTVRIAPKILKHHYISQGSYGVTNLKWFPTWPRESTHQRRLVDTDSPQ